MRQDGNLRRVFHRICKGCGINGHKPYDLRATFATTHILLGTGTPWVSRNLGHKQLSTTETYYCRYLPANPPRLTQLFEETDSSKVPFPFWG